jgi:hypothetical protein
METLFIKSVAGLCNKSPIASLICNATISTYSFISQNKNFDIAASLKDVTHGVSVEAIVICVAILFFVSMVFYLLWLIKNAFKGIKWVVEVIVVLEFWSVFRSSVIPYIASLFLAIGNHFSSNGNNYYDPNNN